MPTEDPSLIPTPIHATLEPQLPGTLLPNLSPPLSGVSSTAAQAGVTGQNQLQNSTAGVGVYGYSAAGIAVSGFSPNGTAVQGQTTGDNMDGVIGLSKSGNGVHGTTSNANGSGTGVKGENAGSGYGVLGLSQGCGVRGEGTGFNADGVFGTGTANGVHGSTDVGLAGVLGETGATAGGPGVLGRGNSQPGVQGTTICLVAGVAGVLGEGPTAGVIGRAGTYQSGPVTTSIMGEGAGDGSVGVVGINTAGPGIWGQSVTADGVVGKGGLSGSGVRGIAATGSAALSGVIGDGADAGTGVSGTSKNGVGVYGTSGEGDGVVGRGGPSGNGVHGYAARGTAGTSQAGVLGGGSDNGNGVHGTAAAGFGVWGFSATGSAGVFGSSLTGIGVHGSGAKAGIQGDATSDGAVAGQFNGNVVATGNLSVTGNSQFAGDIMILGSAHFNGAVTSNSFAAFGGTFRSNGNAIFGAGLNVTGDGNFSGNLVVAGDVMLTNADCAEDFSISCAERPEPGTVMVIDEGGTLRPSDSSYDRRVAGVLSGAGGFKPAIMLDRQRDQQNRLPVALLGKVYCKADAGYAPIELGDMLTTSPTPGHAMRASDARLAFGAVLGKALARLEHGCGLIPILVALQ